MLNRIELFWNFIPLTLSLLSTALFLYAMNWILLAKHPEMGNDRRLPRQLAMFGLTLVCVVVVVLTLPVGESSRNQILALIGVLLSGSIAFSSTTIVSNAMAGIMMRITRPFRTGDFIRAGEHFGRVAERGLLDTEIQTEYRELVSVPNTLLISTPVTVIRSSGTIISVSLSLGYDLHHSHIQSLLIAAADKTGLEDPFTQIIELGDFSITYRISGLLLDVKNIITTRSNLYRNILDTLHTNDIEIVSPTFMNQRRLDDKTKVISKPDARAKEVVETTNAEDIMFDKAEQAERQENAIEILEDEIIELEENMKELSGNEKERQEEVISNKRNEIDKIRTSLHEDNT